MPNRSLVLAAALLAGALPACHRAGAPEVEAPPPARTVLRVVNRNFFDFTIYLVRFGDRVRLGLATGNQTTTFEFPSQFVQTGPVQFEAHPVGGRGRAYTEQLSVLPGDVVSVEIQP
jgi:hypothetical protein